MADTLSLTNLSFENQLLPRTQTLAEKRQNEAKKKWSKKIKKKQCAKFILHEEKPSKSGDGSNSSICKCGYEKSHHTDKALAEEEKDKHLTLKDLMSEEVQTDGLGEIEFKGSTRRSTAMFLRASDNTKPEDLYNYMKEVWGIDTPRILISVTGGAKSFNMDPKLKKLFSKGLIKVASTPGAWVITGGTNTGVMKHVGEALEGATDNLIGVATWGIVTNRDQLTKTDTKRQLYTVSSSLISRGAFLDANHTKFILVDDGTSDKYGREIDLRAAFENYTMSKATKGDAFSQGVVPTVVLVVEGGPGTLRTVSAALTGEQPVPVVIIKDSGRAADCIAAALDVMVDEDLNKPSDEKNNELKELIKDKFPELNTDEKQGEAYLKIVECLKQRQSISVFDMETGSGLDEAILTSLLAVNPSSGVSFDPVQQLRLTILWNRPDLAEQKILSQNTNNWEEKDLHDAMIMALALDRVGFVELFLRYGLNMAEVIDCTRLEFLYAYRNRRLEEGFFPISYEERDVEDVFKLLCGYYGYDARNCFIPHNVTCYNVNKICKKLMKTGIEEFCGLPSELKSGSFEHPFRELFIWAVLNRMHSMALYLWQFGEAGMTKALVASHLYREMASMAAEKDDKELEIECLDNAAKFEDLAIQLLDECARESEDDSIKLITVEFEQFPGITLLSLAVSSNQQRLFSNTLVQATLSDVWKGALKKREVRAWECLLGIFLPPYILWMDFITKIQLEQMVSAGEKEIEDDDDDDADGGDEKEKENESGKKDGSKDSNGESSKLTSSRQSNYQAMDEEEKKKRNDDGSGDSNKKKELGKLEKISEFWKAPVTKFYSNVIAYFLFLGLFSFVALKDKKNDDGTDDTFPGVVEWIVFVFVISLTIEEIRQLIHSDGHSAWDKLKDWASSFWNLLDLSAILLFYVAFSLRFYEEYLEEGQTIYAFDVGLWILRLLDVFHAHRKLGPYVYMIGKMCVEMLYFLVILVIFLVAYGVSVTALLNPQKSNWTMLRDIIFHPYFNIYGELFLGDATATETQFGTEKINNYGETVAFFLLGIYLLIANVLLLNLLIAIFGNTFSDVQEKSDDIWKFKRYELVKEYSTRPLLVPPLILFVHIYMFVQYIVRKCSSKCNKPGKDKTLSVGELKSKVDDDKKEKLIQFEVTAMTKLLRNKRKLAEENEENETKGE